MHTRSPRPAFRRSSLHKRREPNAIDFFKERGSFWIATISVVAFLVGNVASQHGWNVFLASVFGEGIDSTIAQNGTVGPVELLPDPILWAEKYGGNSAEHTFDQAPRDVLIPLPHYDRSEQISTDRPYMHVYSVANLGDYKTGVEESGSHIGVDIRMPKNTPLRSIANGVVEKVGNDPSGFGVYVVIRYPNMPPASETLYATYAHLNSVIVAEGDIVHKAERVAFSGASGNVSGAHLHFQIDRKEAPFHPYWAFGSKEMREAKLNFMGAINSTLFQENGHAYTISPIAYVQSHESSTPSTTVASSRPLTRSERANLFRERSAKRVEQRRTVVAKAQTEIAFLTAAETLAPAAPVEETIVTNRGESKVHSVGIFHDGTFSRGWEKISVRLLDPEGHTLATPDLGDPNLHDIRLRAVYGTVERFRPASVLSPLDFEGKNGELELWILPRGERTVVIEALPYGVLSGPLRFSR